MPIGNSRDLSERALGTLASADLIACEDTRRLAPTLAARAISTRTVSYFEHNEEHRVPELVERMIAGAKIALVSDAGTPGVSDPGFRLVRAALEAGVRVIAIPGPSAVIAALSIAGLPTDRFTFEGFVPNGKGGREACLRRLADETRTMVFYESPRRLESTLDDMTDVFGASRPAAVVREITKTHEETVRGTLEYLVAHFRAEPALGEITIVVAGADEASDRADSAAESFVVTVAMLCDAGLGLKQASDLLARATGRSRREVYQAELARRAARKHQ